MHPVGVATLGLDYTFPVSSALTRRSDIIAASSDGFGGVVLLFDLLVCICSHDALLEQVKLLLRWQ